MPDLNHIKIKVALDVGTSKVRMVIGAIHHNGDIQILGYGSAVSKGMRKGIVNNMELTIDAIAKAKAYAEHTAQCDVKAVTATISGSYINTYHSSGVIKIIGDAVTQEDVLEVMETAKALALPTHQSIIHVFPQEFMIDQQRGIHYPIGLSGIRLESHVQIITCDTSIMHNLNKCIRHFNIEVDDLVLQSIASSVAVLSEDEKDQGICLINIGAGTTDVVIYNKGIVCYSAVIPIAGDAVTNDIARMQRMTNQLAESVKINNGSCLISMISGDEMVELPQAANQSEKRFSRQTLTQIIAARYEEILEAVQMEIERSGFNHLLGAGIVLCGGGALIHGLPQFAENIFHLNVRIGYPAVSSVSPIAGKPEYATALGLLMNPKKNDYHKMYHDDQEKSGLKKLLKFFKAYY